MRCGGGEEGAGGLDEWVALERKTLRKDWEGHSEGLQCDGDWLRGKMREPVAFHKVGNCWDALMPPRKGSGAGLLAAVHEIAMA